VKAGVSPAEIQLIKGVVDWQLKELKQLKPVGK
jgi:hypothetical protein